MFFSAEMRSGALNTKRDPMIYYDLGFVFFYINLKYLLSDLVSAPVPMDLELGLTWLGLSLGVLGTWLDSYQR